MGLFLKNYCKIVKKIYYRGEWIIIPHKLLFSVRYFGLPIGVEFRALSVYQNFGIFFIKIILFQNVTNDNSRCRKLKSKPTENVERPTCRCGTAAVRPGKLTCSGQRCACYMQNKACSSCRCRGCRNPHMMDGVKVV